MLAYVCDTAYNRLVTTHLIAGDYLATYAEFGGEDHSTGSCCGYSDSELASIRRELSVRELTLRVDDVGIRVEWVKS
jgi:hypothetical protein